jgi:hypothetical protein
VKIHALSDVFYSRLAVKDVVDCARREPNLEASVMVA